MRLIVAGGRDFKDMQRACAILDHVVSKQTGEITVVCGMARGADAIGYAWAKARGYKIAEFPADWNTHGKSAGYKRNKQMAEYATHCVCFWDGLSRGTKHMIDLCEHYSLPLKVYSY